MFKKNKLFNDFKEQYNLLQLKYEETIQFKSSVDSYVKKYYAISKGSSKIYGLEPQMKKSKP